MARKAKPKEYPITKDGFERLLSKVFTTPIDVQGAKRTSESHPCDGCSGKRRRQGKTEGTEG